MTTDAQHDGDRVGPWADLMPAGAIAMLAFAAYGFAVAPGPTLLDSAELASAAASLGLAHPPGEPLALVWGRGWAFLPFGGLAFRVGLSQAAAGGMAAGLVFLLALALIRRFDATGAIAPAGRGLIAAAAAMGFALAPGALQVAARPEVYALGSLLALAALVLAVGAARASDPRGALGAAFCIGLGLGNHPLIAGAAGLGAVVAALPLLWRSGVPRFRLLLGSVGALLAGAAVIVYLPARGAAVFADPRSSAGDLIAWGDPRTPAGLWWILSARTFVDKAAVVHRNEDSSSLPFVLMDELSLPLALLALAGAYALFRRAATRPIAAAVVTAVVGSIGAGLVAGLDPNNPDVRGYLGAAIAALAALAAAGAAFLLLLVRRRGWQIGVAGVLLALVVVRGAPIYPTASLRGAQAAQIVSDQTLAALPPRTALLTGHFENGFLLSYARGVEAARPDVAWAHLGWNRGPGYAERLSRAWPELGPLLHQHLSAPLSLAALSQLALHRPVMLEPMVDLSAAAAAALRPGRMAWSFDGPTPSTPAPADQAPSVAGLDPGLLALLEDEATRNREVRGFLAWRLVLDARHACATARPEAAAYLAALRARLPDDTVVKQLAAACGGEGRGP